MQLEYLQSELRQTLYPLGCDPVFEGVYTLKPDYLDSKLIGVPPSFSSKPTITTPHISTTSTGRVSSNWGYHIAAFQRRRRTC